MAWRHDEPDPQTALQEFHGKTVDHLKPLARLLTPEVPTRKGDLVGLLARHMTDPAPLRALYDRLDPLARTAVQVAVAHPRGLLLTDPFIAHHGSMPHFHTPAAEPRPWYDYRQHERPTLLALFFPNRGWLPTDVRSLLQAFVPPPPEFALPTQAEPPATVKQTWDEWDGHKSVQHTEDVPVRVRMTARDAEQDVRAVLRLAEAGRLKITDKKLQPTAATLQAVAHVLADGDFYTDEDAEDWDHDPASDLVLKPFAWPMLLQAGGLAEKSGTSLALTAPGRKALAGPAADAIRAVFRKWRSSTLLDEFSRVEAVKGQSKGLSALAPRRNSVLDGLAGCPAGAWFAVDDFFRFLRATGRDFTLAHNPGSLYIGDQHYGRLEEMGGDQWLMLEGRYTLAVLFENLATLGLVDVAYLPPQDARDTSDHVHDLSCLSRYDGLTHVRINPLGAWCLGLAERYAPEAPPPAEAVLRVLPNLDVVAISPPLPAAERLVLERFAEPGSESVWKLSPAKVQAALEEGSPLAALEELLATRALPPLPGTVETFLRDQRERAGRLRDLGTARLIECADAPLAQQLANDPQLRGKCHVAGERLLVFQAADDAAVRKALRRLGMVLPPQA